MGAGYVTRPSLDVRRSAVECAVFFFRRVDKDAFDDCNDAIVSQFVEPVLEPYMIH